MTIEVVNKYKIQPRDTDIYIGRGSPLGNPWPITKEASRATVIQRYEGWLRGKIQANDETVCNALSRIANRHLDGQPVRLVCFCKPQACHGDIIKDVILKAIQGSQE